MQPSGQKKIPGLKAGEVATGIEVHILVPSQQGELNVQIQASAPATHSPLQLKLLLSPVQLYVHRSLIFLAPLF